MVRRIFQYLVGTQNYGISFNGDSRLIAFSDSDYSDPVTGHSTSGILIIREGPVIWTAQKQRLVATATSEAEYRAAVSAIDEVCWIRRLGSELGVVDLIVPTELCIDNKSALYMLDNAYEEKITKVTYRNSSQVYPATHW